VKEKQNYLIRIFFLIALSLAGTSNCRRQHANEKRYDLNGKVVAVEKEKHLVTIAHDDIKDYMPGMTMPFPLREEWAYEVLVPGDQITATLVVDGNQSWLENVIITQESTDTSTASSTGGSVEAKPGDEVPNFGLVNQDGKTIGIHDYRGKALLLTFIYTRCPLPEYCTLMSNNFAQIEGESRKQPALYAKSHLLSITIDPDYDTAKVLRSYGSAHTGRYSDETFDHWEFASGTKDQVKGIAQFFGLRYFADNDQIIHGLRTVIISPDGKVYKVYRGNDWKPDDVLKELQAISDKDGVVSTNITDGSQSQGRKPWAAIREHLRC
jgi:protein SCO1/2